MPERGESFWGCNRNPLVFVLHFADLSPGEESMPQIQ
jgi:hypothetical protein